MRTTQKVKDFLLLQLLKALGIVTSLLLLPAKAYAVSQTVKVDETALGFEIPSFADILTFIIRAFFVVAGVFALLYLLLGAFAWITSGGNKENVEKARDKIQAAIVGVILIIVVVAIAATLEQIVFNQTVCFGLTCDLSIPALLQPNQ